MSSYPYLTIVAGVFAFAGLGFLLFLKREADRKAYDMLTQRTQVARRQNNVGEVDLEGMQGEPVVDPAMSRLNIDIAMKEAALVWARYGAFVVLNGFLVNSVARSGGASEMVFVLIGTFGLIINSAWHVLNCSGWKNQYLFLHYAAVYAQNGTLGLPYERFRDVSMLNQFGWIYRVAQIVPQLCFLLSVVSASTGLYNMLIKSTYKPDEIATHRLPYILDVSVPVVVFAMACILVAYSIEKYFLFPMGKDDVDRPVV